MVTIKGFHGTLSGTSKGEVPLNLPFPNEKKFLNRHLLSVKESSISRQSLLALTAREKKEVFQDSLFLLLLEASGTVSF